jgi:hypothetical protein
MFIYLMVLEAAKFKIEGLHLVKDFMSSGGRRYHKAGQCKRERGTEIIEGCHTPVSSRTYTCNN